MKPFSLDEYKKNNNLPIVTRGGNPAKIVSTMLGGSNSIGAVIKLSDCYESIIHCTINGKYLNSGRESNYDLFFDVEEPKQCNFNPFDKVLVRDNDTDIWHPRFFGKALYYNTSLYFETLTSCIWNQCIPYNEETAGLIYTDNPAPAKYIIW